MRLIRSVEPSVEALATQNPRRTAFMQYFAAGDARPDRHEVGVWTPLTEISPLLAASVVKTEDRAFFSHQGADWHAMGRSLRASVRARRIVGGASTITQQLARNLYLSPSRSPVRKAYELWLAFGIDRALSKARILELYLNVIEWGRGAWGCAAASERHFQKPPRDLDLFESTFLASLIAAPKAPLAGRNAARSRNVQLETAYQLFLSGLIGGEDCARCCHRTWHLHRLLAAGTPLSAALSHPADVKADVDGAILREVAAALGLRRIPPAELLTSHYGEEQQRNAINQLRVSGDRIRAIAPAVRKRHASLMERTNRSA